MENNRTSCVCIFSFKKSFWKANRNNWRTRGQKFEALELLKLEENKKEIKSVEGLFAKYMRSNEIKKESNDIKKLEEIIKRKKSEYEINIYIYIYIYIYIFDFQHFEK